MSQEVELPAARVAATADAFVSGHEGKRQNLRVGAFRLEVRERRLLHGGQPLQQLATMMEIAIQAIADGEEVCQCVGAQCARCRGQPTLRLSSQSCGNEEPLDRREIHLEFSKRVLEPATGAVRVGGLSISPVFWSICLAIEFSRVQMD